MTDSLTAVLSKRIRHGSAPLVTWYDTTSGARTELSATSYANWIEKTANLLDSLGVGPHDTVALPLLMSHPGHWMSLIWPLAVWERAAICHVTPRTLRTGAGVVVVGPDDPDPVSGCITVACSLDPFARGLAGLPEGVLDYTTNALGQSDVAIPESLTTADLAWIDPDRSRTHAHVLSVAPESGRVLVRPTDPWTTLCQAIIGPLLGGGSCVIVEGDPEPDRLAHLAATERVTRS